MALLVLTACAVFIITQRSDTGIQTFCSLCAMLFVFVMLFCSVTCAEPKHRTWPKHFWRNALVFIFIWLTICHLLWMCCLYWLCSFVVSLALNPNIRHNPNILAKRNGIHLSLSCHLSLLMNVLFISLPKDWNNKKNSRASRAVVSFYCLSGVGYADCSGGWS